MPSPNTERYVYDHMRNIALLRWNAKLKDMKVSEDKLLMFSKEFNED